MLKGLKNHLLKIHRDEKGAMSVETILIICLISVPLIILLYLFRGYLATWFQGAKTDLDTPVNNKPTLN